MHIVQIQPTDDLEALATALNQATWDEANDMSKFSADAIASCLEHSPHTYYFACYIEEALAGIALGYIMQKPYKCEKWLYVDEIDTAVPHRRKGVGRALMEQFFTIAKEQGCTELWLGAEIDDEGANAFYQSLKPTEVEKFVGYTFRV